MARDSPSSPWATRDYVRLRKLAEASTSTVVVEAKHPDDADLVLFVSPACRYQSDVLISAMYRRYSERAVVFDSSDLPTPTIPGIYTSLHANSWNDGRFASGHYLRVAENKSLDYTQWQTSSQRYLFSFVGRVANHVSSRSAVTKLSHPRGFVRDTSSNQADGSIDYAKLLAESKFVIAPRGIGVSSWRLFEAMRMRRAVIIISDEWVPPLGVDWDSFSIRVPEHEIARLPKLLEVRENDSRRMSDAASAQWDKCFSSHNCFEWIGTRLATCYNTARASDRPGACFKNVKGIESSLRFAQGLLRAAFKL